MTTPFFRFITTSRHYRNATDFLRKEIKEYRKGRIDYLSDKHTTIINASGMIGGVIGSVAGIMVVKEDILSDRRGTPFSIKAIKYVAGGSMGGAFGGCSGIIVGFFSPVVIGGAIVSIPIQIYF